MHPGSITVAKRRSRSLAYAAAYTAERLETRRMLSVAKDTAGWTHIGQDSGGAKIYVDNVGGSDSNNGLAPSNAGGGVGPVATIAKARSLIHDGHDDWLLLKAGDTFNEPIG